MAGLTSNPVPGYRLAETNETVHEAGARRWPLRRLAVLDAARLNWLRRRLDPLGCDTYRWEVERPPTGRGWVTVAKQNMLVPDPPTHVASWRIITATGDVRDSGEATVTNVLTGTWVVEKGQRVPVLRERGDILEVTMERADR